MLYSHNLQQIHSSPRHDNSALRQMNLHPPGLLSSKDLKFITLGALFFLQRLKA